MENKVNPKRRNSRDKVSAETLAHWYFRLNGFMTMENFVLHPESRRGSQRTDADIFGVRFPHRKEYGMRDEESFTEVNTKPLFVVAEIKEGECKLNGPWTRQSDQNMHYVLAAMGMLKPSLIDRAATNLYRDYRYEDDDAKIELLVVGSRINQEYQRDRPNLKQLLFKKMLGFIYKRFHEFHMQKSDHQQWDATGEFLYNKCGADEAEFVSAVLSKAGLTSSQ